jgi:hypothetical protein
MGQINTRQIPIFRPSVSLFGVFTRAPRNVLMMKPARNIMSGKSIFYSLLLSVAAAHTGVSALDENY